MMLVVLLGSLAVLCGISVSLNFALSEVRRRTGVKDEVGLLRCHPIALRHFAFHSTYFLLPSCRFQS